MFAVTYLSVCVSISLYPFCVSTLISISMCIYVHVMSALTVQVPTQWHSVDPSDDKPLERKFHSAVVDQEGRSAAESASL